MTGQELFRGVFVFLGFLLGLTGMSATRGIPVPLPEHPGNVCLERELLTVELPVAFKEAVRWELSDADGRNVARGACGRGAKAVEAGALPVGWYRLAGIDASG